MSTGEPHVAAATTALVEALGDRLAPGITRFGDLFTEDAVLEVPFDSDGTARPLVGRAVIAGTMASLAGILTFETCEVTAVYDVDPATVVYEAKGLLHRADLGGRFHRRYICIARLHDGRIRHLREHGGPFTPLGPVGSTGPVRSG